MSRHAVAEPESALIPPAERPKLPLSVPALVDLAGRTIPAEVLGSTTNVLLVRALGEGVATLANVALGTPVRLRPAWDRQMFTGRLAAHGIAGRFLVSLGERAIRRSRRSTVDLPGIARSGQLYNPAAVRIVDLSAGGARIEGVDLPIGSDVSLHFTPPVRGAPADIVGWVVRAIEHTEVPSVGIAFGLMQTSLESLVSAAR